MCYFNAKFAGIGEVIYAVDRDNAAAAGFDYRSSYQMLANFPGQWPMNVYKYVPTQALKPFKIWREGHW